jgi:hypothetical protein
MSQIDDLQKKLAELDEEHGDIGAYKDYSSVVSHALKIIDEFHTREVRLIEMYNNIESKVDEVANTLDRRWEGARKEFSKHLVPAKEGTLGIQLVYDKREPAEDLNDVDVTISGEHGSWTLRTEPLGSIIQRNDLAGDNREAYCEKKLAPGTYEISVKLDKKTINRKVTIDGNQLFVVKVPLELRNPQQGYLYVQAGNNFDFYTSFFGSHKFSGIEVEISREDGFKQIVETQSSDPVKKPNSFSVLLPGGNYSLSAVYQEQEIKKKITLNGDRSVYLRFG